MWHAHSLDGLLPGQLGPAIAIKRVRRVVFGVGMFFRTIKHVIRGIMNKRRIQPFSFLRHDAWGSTIDGHGKIRLGFRLIHSRIGGGVDDKTGPNFPDDLSYGIRIGQVHFLLVHSRHLAQWRKGALQFPSDLAVLSGEENIDHSNISASRKARPALSLPESSGSPPPGHSIARAGSFQTIVRSNCG